MKRNSINELLNNPSTSAWINEFGSILKGARNMSIERQGSPASYIEHLINNSNNSEFSRICFKEAFNKIFINEIDKCPPDLLFIFLNISSSFNLFNYIELLLRKIISKSFHDQDDIELRNSIYLEMSYFIRELIHFNQLSSLDSYFNKEIINFSRRIIGSNPNITSIAFYNRLSLGDKTVDITNLNDTIILKISNLTLLTPNLILNEQLSDAIGLIYIIKPEIIRMSFSSKNCFLSRDKRKILFNDKTIQLSLSNEIWQSMLLKGYEEVSPSSIIQKHLEN